MDLPATVVFTAIVIKTVALGLFIWKRRCMPRWVFWNLSAMLVVMIIRMTFLALHMDHWAQYTSLFIAIEVLITVIYACYLMCKTEREFRQLRNENKSLAHQLAEHLALSRAKIQYYEDHAARTGIPLYREKEAGK